MSINYSSKNTQEGHSMSSNLVCHRTMLEQDPLEVILRVSRILGHVSVKFDQTTSKYNLVLVSNVILIATMQVLYAWYVHVTLTQRIAIYGFAYSLLIILDSQLCFCGCYIMIFNGLAQSKNTIKLLNIINYVRRERRRNFATVKKTLT